jgi:hypothetical protein
MKAENRRLRPAQITADKYAFNAVQNIVGYAPSKSETSIDAINELLQLLEEKRKVETHREGEFKAARDNTVAAEHAFHQAVLEMKDQVRAQFGKDSNELQSLGLKKKSEYKSPKRKRAKA